MPRSSDNTMIRRCTPWLLGVMILGARGGWSAPLQWEPFNGHRAALLPVPPGGKTGFTLIPPRQSGVDFTNQLSYERSQANQNMLNGAGVAAGDYDGDGLCDLYFCTLEGRNALFRNLGNWQFEDVTSAAGVACDHQISRGAVFADINGDGHLDLLVSSLSGPNACYINDGQGRFKNLTEELGLISPPAGGHSMALADIDGDGDLDLYIANYGENSILRSGGSITVRYINGRPVIRGRHAKRIKIIDGYMLELGEPDALYLNDGTGRFKAADWTDGRFRDHTGAPLREAPWDMGLSAMFRDINQDGFPDLYVCNDFQTPDRIWINNGRGQFQALPDEAIRGTPHFSMGVDFADIDRDGRDDFFVGDMLSRWHPLRMTQIGATNPPPAHLNEPTDRQQFRRNGLYLNRGDGSYAEIANFSGVAASDWSWSVLFLDVDLDGYEDLLVANGHAYDTQDLDMNESRPSGVGQVPMSPGKALKDYPPLRTPNVAFRNRGDLTFQEVGGLWGFDSPEITHGLALADLDNDGDLDMIGSCLWAVPLLYRNDSSAPRVAIRLRGQPPNIQAIGARIRFIGGPVTQSQEIISGGRYLAADDPMRVFAASGATGFTAEITWRSGAVTTLDGLKPNYIYEITEPEGAPARTPAEQPRQPAVQWFSEVQLNHRHSERPFDDFSRQPLLDRHLSHVGPPVAWADLDQDGQPELFVGAGHGHALGVFRVRDNQLTPWVLPAWTTLAPADMTSIASWVNSSGRGTLLIARSSYESPSSNPWPLVSIASDSQKPVELPGLTDPSGSTPGPIAVADLDGDGDLDVFIGGRMIPGRYPEPASSMLYFNQNGTLVPHPSLNRLFRGLGLVTAARFSDLTGDGWPELILACEWGPIRVFLNEGGVLHDATVELGLAEHLGWWQGVATGDFDGDGRLDIVAANWGLNSSYTDHSSQPISLYFADLDDNGTLELLETLTDPNSQKQVQRRDLLWLSRGWPLIRARFATHKAFSQADFPTIVGRPIAQLRQLQANTFASTLFLNRAGKFEPRPLPTQAQFAPAFGVSVADFNGDGYEDLFLAQNYFSMRAEEPRLDSGLGLMLKGIGDGTFEIVPAQTSGLRLHGAQRGSAVADFDNDGRPDLAVGQNQGRTKVFRNELGRPGLRVRLVGPPTNPEAIGAQLRLRFNDRRGPVREIHAGSGHRSQDSTLQVLATPETPTHLWVRWPGGKTTETPVPPDARDIRVTMDGQAE